MENVATCRKRPVVEEVLLLDVRAVARLLSLSVRTVWRLNDLGQMPRPLRIRAAVRWHREDIDAWLRECRQSAKPLRALCKP
jgi:predicted DNA-binding transcriptional regulator AlpA